jgi:hypothetical protein
MLGLGSAPLTSRRGGGRGSYWTVYCVYKWAKGQAPEVYPQVRYLRSLNSNFHASSRW